MPGLVSMGLRRERPRRSSDGSSMHPDPSGRINAFPDPRRLAVYTAVPIALYTVRVLPS
jgi:hypothetical protein